MQNLVICLVLAGVLGLSVSIGLGHDSYAITLGMSSDQILKTQDLVILGHVESVNLRADMTEYTVNVIELVKSLDEFKVKDKIIVAGCPQGQRGGCHIFEEGEYVMFVLKKNKVLQVSEYSFVAPNPNCSVNDFFEMHDAKYGLETVQDNQTKQFITGKPIEITFYAYNKLLDVNPYKVTVEFFKAFNNTVFSKTFEGMFEECVPNVKMETTFTPKDMGIYGKRYTASYGGGEMAWGFPIIEIGSTPLKQIHSGIKFEDILCNNDRILIQNYDNTPACVYPSSFLELYSRGWIHSDFALSGVLDPTVREEILEKLRVGKTTPLTKTFFESESKKDKIIGDLLEDYKYETQCCLFKTDKDQYNRYVEIIFDIPEKNSTITVTYDLKLEEIKQVITK